MFLFPLKDILYHFKTKIILHINFVHVCSLQKKDTDLTKCHIARIALYSQEKKCKDNKN